MKPRVNKNNSSGKNYFFKQDLFNQMSKPGKQTMA